MEAIVQGCSNPLQVNDSHMGNAAWAAHLLHQLAGSIIKQSPQQPLVFGVLGATL